MNDIDKATDLLRQFKGNAYLYGAGVLSQIGPWVRRTGDRAALIRGTFPGSDKYVRIIGTSLRQAGIDLTTEIRGARPNTPKEDVLRISSALRRVNPNVVVSFGGGSTIDAVKAANVVRTLGGEIDDYFGTDVVTKALRGRGLTLVPHVAIQTVASSAAHLTKYANVTDLATSQKKLVVDHTIIPAHPVFDYGVTHGTPRDLTIDGAFDGLSHMLEVLYGALGKPHYDTAAEIAMTGLPLVLTHLPRVMSDPSDACAREALCLATDLGGYAIMIGGTNGGHLTSFSLVDVLPHGRACALMNSYYTVFFAPAIEKPLRLLGEIFNRLGLTNADWDALEGRTLGLAAAEAMFTFARSVGFPTRLRDVEGFKRTHIERALAAAKDPQLKMKLANMPVPLTAEMVDEYMGPVLEAACDGDLASIRNVPERRG